MTDLPDRTVDTADRGLLARMLGTAILKPSVCEEVARSRGATTQAALLVVLVSGIATIQDYGLGWLPMVSTGMVNLLHWPVWAGIAYLVGHGRRGASATRGGSDDSEGSATGKPAADWNGVLRVLGFARVPGMLVILAPVLGGIQFAAHVWMLAIGAVGIRQALGIGTFRAVLAMLLGMIPYWVAVALYLH